MTLKVPQAGWLDEVYTNGGALIQAPAGSGKTVLTALAPALLAKLHPSPPKKPLLVVPAALLKHKTPKDFRDLAQHWQLVAMRMVSYSLLSVVSGANFLENEKPDMLILDESHCVKNPRASCTRRIHRYVKACRAEGRPLRVVAMSGTLSKRSLRDFWHVAWWCRPDACPLPEGWEEMIDWAGAIDEKVGESDKLDPGALMLFAKGEEGAREALRRRIFLTPGFVTSPFTGVDCSLYVNVHAVASTPAVDAAFETLRTRWELPDGQPISDAVTFWRHARELSQGFWYMWRPSAPEDWLAARKAWFAWVREILKHHGSAHLDSPLQVAQMVAKVGPAHPAHAAYEAWRNIRDTFTPNTVAQWIDDSALNYAAAWKGPGVIWTEHNEFGVELSRRTGLPYYGAGGLDAKGRAIDDTKAGDTVIASVAANHRGRNLQHFSRALIMSAPPTGILWEQLLARHHRQGQEADEVVIDVYAGCAEQLRGIEQARNDNTYHQEFLDMPARLVTCDLDLPDLTPSGWAWTTP